jgi:glutaredoxin
MFYLKRSFLLIFVFSFLFIPSLATAEKLESSGLEIQILSSPTCPHCNEAKAFLNDLQASQMPALVIYDYNISNNVDKARELYQEYNLPQQYQGLVPVIFIADRYFVGFSEQTGQEITNFIATLEDGDNYFKELASENKSAVTKLPLIGEVDLMNYSLPSLAITLGIVDGFNVCSLGALVLILGLVIALKSRKRIFILGGSFLLATALVYGLLIFLWHQFFSFIAPYIRSLELLIGLLAITGGAYLLWEFYKAYKSGPICSSNNMLSRLSPKVEAVFRNKTNWFLLTGTVILFAGVVTIIEFPCSAFLPVLFTSILVEAGTSQSASLGYIALYMLFYLLDELVVFLIAVFTMKIKIVSPRFIIFFNLLAALIFLFLGVFYLAGWTL